MTRPVRRVMISAGEASGDRLGAGLAAALRQRDPAIELIGMGGPQMRDAGVRLVQDSAEVSVVGIWEVLSRLPQIRRAMHRLERVLEDERPDLLVPIDFPDFNLRLAARAGRNNIGVVYFVSPQVWAWRPRRVHQIRRLVREMLVLFDFEREFYRNADVPVTWVGHPLAEAPPETSDRADLRRRIGLLPDSTAIALLPGSRAGEIKRHMPVLLGAAALLRRERPALEFLVPLAPSAPGCVVRDTIRDSGLERIHVHAGDFPGVLRVCAAGAVASGTASLDAAMVGLPMVVIYRMSPITYWIGKRLIQVDHIAMPNLIAGRGIVPELLQDECNAARIAAELDRYLGDPSHAESVRNALQAVSRKLGDPGVYARAAERVLAHLPRPGTVAAPAG
ncbi:MAG: lipid-A-disaccharide synthase [Acidobacteriota bacterium]